jgi:glycolate oxidase iron-sulfur subunit
VRNSPRKVLQSIPELDFVEMAEADRCCGGAGTFALLHYDYSTQILDRKIDNAVATGAETLATGCPACRMQLSHGLARRAKRAAGAPQPKRVLHPVEFLARTYGD